MHAGWTCCVIYCIQLNNQVIFRNSQDASVLLSSLKPMKQENKKQKRRYLISLECSYTSELLYEEGLNNVINIGSGKAKAERRMHWLHLAKEAEVLPNLLKAERWTRNMRYMPGIDVWKKEGDKGVKGRKSWCWTAVQML